MRRPEIYRFIAICPQPNIYDFKKIFSLSDNNTEGYYDIKTGSNYFAAGASSALDNGIGGIGGGGNGSTIFNSSIVYNGLDNTGSGGSGYRWNIS